MDLNQLIPSDEVRSRYILEKKLAQTSTSIILLVRDSVSHVQRALKSINLQGRDQEQIDKFTKEGELLKTLSHENIIRFYDCYQDATNFYLVLEYASQGTLADLIGKHKKSNENFQEDEILGWAVQLFKGLEYIHSKNIIHRDVKPDNIFFDEFFKIKIGDFGVSKKLNGYAKMTSTFCGTPLYLPPQPLTGDSYTFAFDVFSLGCVLYEMCCLSPPFSGKFSDLFNGKRLQQKPEQIPGIYSQQLSNMIFWMLQKEEKDRPTFTQLLKSAFIQRFISYGEIGNIPIEVPTISEVNINSSPTNTISKKVFKFERDDDDYDIFPLKTEQNSFETIFEDDFIDTPTEVPNDFLDTFHFPNSETSTKVESLKLNESIKKSSQNLNTSFNLEFDSDLSPESIHESSDDQLPEPQFVSPSKEPSRKFPSWVHSNSLKKGEMESFSADLRKSDSFASTKLLRDDPKQKTTGLQSFRQVSKRPPSNFKIESPSFEKTKTQGENFPSVQFIVHSKSCTPNEILLIEAHPPEETQKINHKSPNKQNKEQLTKISPKTSMKNQFYNENASQIPRVIPNSTQGITPSNSYTPNDPYVYQGFEGEEPEIPPSVQVPSIPLKSVEKSPNENKKRIKNSKFSPMQQQQGRGNNEANGALKSVRRVFSSRPREGKKSVAPSKSPAPKQERKNTCVETPRREESAPCGKQGRNKMMGNVPFNPPKQVVFSVQEKNQTNEQRESFSSSLPRLSNPNVPAYQSSGLLNAQGSRGRIVNAISKKNFIGLKSDQKQSNFQNNFGKGPGDQKHILRNSHGHI